MLTTHCPKCLTAFRVSQGQIEAREGKVRCGRCGAVFDARATLSEQIEESQRACDPTPPPEQPNLAITPDHAYDAGRSRLMATDNAETSEKEPGKEEVRARGSWVAKESETREFSFGRSIEPTRVRRTGWLAPTLLLLVLVGQVVVHYRGEVALFVPEFKVQIKAVCEALGWELPLPRRPELMSIESSDLRADTTNPAVMVLAATLRNRAAFAQTYPALELTLTDLQDRPLARRVLSAQQYLGETARIDSGFAANSELPVKVFIEAASLGAAGYRLYLFFP